MKENSIWKYITDYKTNSIIFKHFFTILLIIILPMSILFSGIYTAYMKAYNIELSNNYNQRLSNIANSLDSIYTQTRLFTYSIAKNPAVADFANENNSRELYQKTDFAQIMGTYHIAYKYIESVYLYSSVNRYVLSGGYNDVIENFTDKSWLTNYSYLLKNELAVVPRKINDEYPYCLSFIQCIYNDLGEKTGAVIVNLNIETLLKTVTGDSVSNHEIYILNAYKKLVLSNNIDRIFDQFNQYAYIYERMNDTQKNNGFISNIKSSSSGLEYIGIFTSNADNISVKSIFIIIGLILAALFVTLLVSVLLTIRTFKPIQSIMEAVGKNFNSENEMGINDEISFIIQNINSTIQDKRLAEIELEERIALLNNAYTAALQAQINPHFLYNTLETINFMAYKHFKRPNDISDITVSLSKMLRIGLDSENKLVPLKTEVEHLSLYIKIIELRYPQKCQFEFDIDDDLMDCTVVKLMLQPLVENAFQHGIRPLGHMGIIRISAYRDNNNLCFKIEDNGVGMNKKTLHSVQKLLASDIYLSSKHIGINNVNRRIKMLLGTDYGLSVQSVQNKGTVFIITLPYEKPSN